jgi:universal stress protein E
MKLVEKILMPIDVNKLCKEQLNSAIKIAKEFNSEVSVMYVLPETEVHPEIRELLTKYINETLDKVVKTLDDKKVSYSQPIIDSGSPVDKILKTANEQNANLILVCSGNKAENEEFKLGTTAEKLIQLSDVPVWVAKSDKRTEIEEILCPIDFSDPAKRALRNAILLSNNFEAKLHILGVFEPFFTASPRIEIDQKLENEKLQKQFQQEMHKFLSEFNLKGVNHSIEIQEGIPHEKILESIQKNGISLLVMGTNGRSGFSRIIMGSVTEKVIRQLPCSFVTTKTQNIFELRLDSEIKEIETHFSNATKLQKSGLYKEAIQQCLICLQINDMHVPSMFKLAKLYEFLGDDAKVAYYEKTATEVLRRLWDKKIEFEIRQHYKPNS